MWAIYKKQRKNTKIKETVDLQYIYQNELDKFCLQHDMAYGDLTTETAYDKILRDRAFNIAKTPKYDGYQRSFFDKKFASLADKSASGSGIKNENM